MRAQEIAEIIATALERVPGKKPRIVRDNGSQFVAKEWREVMRHFEVEEIPIRVRHPESKGRIERYHRSVRGEAFADTEAEKLYRARDLLAEWVRYYTRSGCILLWNICAPLTTTWVARRRYWLSEKTKLREAAARRKKVNRGKKEIRLVNRASKLWQSERGAEAIAEARS